MLRYDDFIQQPSIFFADGHKIEQYVDRGKHVYICWMVCVCALSRQFRLFTRRNMILRSNEKIELDESGAGSFRSLLPLHVCSWKRLWSRARTWCDECVCVPNSMFIDTAVVVASDVGRRTSTCSRTISTVKSLKWLSMFTCFWGVASRRMAMKWIFIAISPPHSSTTRWKRRLCYTSSRFIAHARTHASDDEEIKCSSKGVACAAQKKH